MLGNLVNTSLQAWQGPYARLILVIALVALCLATPRLTARTPEPTANVTFFLLPIIALTASFKSVAALLRLGFVRVPL